MEKGFDSSYTWSIAPPDGLSYDEFFSIRSEALVEGVQDGARLKKYDTVVCIANFQPLTA
jgi:hypothetical protein